MVEALSGGRWQGSSTADADPDKTSSQFASGTWTSQGDSGILSESSGVITLSVDSADDNKDSGFTFDLGSGNVSDSTWTLRTKFIYTSNNISPNNQAFTVAFGIADSTTISGEGETNGNDIINPTIHFQDNTNNCYMVIDSTPTAGNNRTTRMTIGDTYYLQVQRVSADLAEFKVFSDSTYETQVGTTSSNTTTSSLTGGRYVFVHFFSQTVSSGSISASFSEWEFWNGLPTKDEKTTLTNVPANTRYEETDTRKIYRRQVSNASYESDFSTNSGNDAWVTSNSSNYNINSSSSGKLYGVGNNDGTDFIYHDMQLNLGSGTNLSDTAFVIRIKNLKWGAVDETYQHWTFGCSDSTVNPRVTSSDAFGMHQAKTGASSTANAAFDMSGTAFSYSSDTGAPSISTDNQNIELIRDGTNISMTCYGTDDTFTTKVGSTVTKAIGSATNIRYIMFFDKNEHTATTNSFTVEAVNVYNGTTSAKDAKWIERGTA